jgi:hypothetical protein
VTLFEQMAELRRTVAAQADEIARLKGGPRRPNLKPSGMEKATEPKPDRPAGEGNRKRGSTKSKLGAVACDRATEMQNSADGQKVRKRLSYMCASSGNFQHPACLLACRRRLFNIFSISPQRAR